MGESAMDGKESYLKKNKQEDLLLEISWDFSVIFNTSDMNCSAQLQEGQGYMPANAEDQSPLQQQSFLKNIN